MRVRYYGFLANRNRSDQLALARALIDDNRTCVDSSPIEVSSQPTSPGCADSESELDVCPVCRKGRIVLVLRVGYPTRKESWSFDSS